MYLWSSRGKEIVKAVSHLDELTGGYDFAKVLSITIKVL